MNPNSHLIVVDGIDGSGKTTITRYLQKLLSTPDNPALIYKAFGEGMVGRKLRDRLLDPDFKADEDTEVLYIASSIQETYNEQAKFSLEQGCTIIYDRFISSYYAYQCVGRDSRAAKAIFETIFMDPKNITIQPELYIYCKVDLDVAEKRIQERGNENYLDKETREFKEKVVLGFDEFFEKKTKSKVVTIDCNQGQDIVFENVKQAIENFVLHKKL